MEFIREILSEILHSPNLFSRLTILPPLPLSLYTLTGCCCYSKKDVLILGLRNCSWQCHLALHILLDISCDLGVFSIKCYHPPATHGTQSKAFNRFLISCTYSSTRVTTNRGVVILSAAVTMNGIKFVYLEEEEDWGESKIHILRHNQEETITPTPLPCPYLYSADDVLLLIFTFRPIHKLLLSSIYYNNNARSHLFSLGLSTYSRHSLEYRVVLSARLRVL